MSSSIERLPNGLGVVFKESHGAQVVAFQMWVGVGSADERPHEAGLAHVLEHMLFKGTARRGVGEIARDVERAGGYINAWTSHDETVFHITMASRYAEQGLDVLADAVTSAALDPDELAMELNVILEEIRMGEDNPSRVTTEELFSNIFRKHPYGRPVIGNEATVGSFDRRVVNRFYKRWYIPSNTVLVVAGDFDSARMMKLVKKALGGWRGKGKPARATRSIEPQQRGSRQGSRVLPVSEANLAVGFPIPGFSHDDVPALDILAAVLGQGASSRLETVVRRELGLAFDVRALSFTPRDLGVFAIFAMAAPTEVGDLLAAIARETFRLVNEPISPREVEKARSLLMSEAVYSEETVDGMARKLGYYGLHSGDVEFERRYMAGLATADSTQLREVARRYLVGSKASLAVVLPDPTQRKTDRRVPWVVGKGSRARIDKSRLKGVLGAALSEGEASSRRARVVSGRPRTVVHTLTSGDTLVIRTDSGSKTVAARASFLGGLRHEPASRGGLSTLLANSLTRGTRTMGAGEVAMRMDTLACNVSGFTGRNTIGIHGEFLSRNFAEGFVMMADCLRNPALEIREVEREKQLLIDEIRSSRDNLDIQAFELFQRTMYGKHPYGRSIMGTEESVAGLEPDHIRSYLSRATGAGRMVLAVVGGADPNEVIDLTEQHLLSGGKGGKAPSNPAAPRPVKGPRQVGLDRTKEQSHMVVGFPGITLDGEDRFAIDVLMEILGGHGGRLFASVREERGLAYSVTAMSVEGIEPGYLALYAGTSPGREGQVLEAMLQVLEQTRQKRPPGSEIGRVKRHLIGSRAIAGQRNGSRAASASLGQLYGLGHDIDERYPAELRKVTAQDVVEVARRYFVEDRMIICCVGPGGDGLKLI